MGAAFVGENDDREVQVGAGEGQVGLAFRGGHDAGQQVDAALAGLREHLGPAAGLDGLELDTKAVLDQGDVIGGQSLVAAFLVAKFERRP